MSDYCANRDTIYNSIHLGILAEVGWDGPRIKPGQLTDDQIAWLASWLAGDGIGRIRTQEEGR